MTTGRADAQIIASEYKIFRGALAKLSIEPILDKVNLVLDDSRLTDAPYTYGPTTVIMGIQEFC